MRIEPQNFRTIESDELVPTAEVFKSAGYRFVQCFAARVENGFELTYSFDKDLVLENIRINLPDGVGIRSISGVFGASFVFENEMHDLFGIEVSDISVDFKGKFYHVTTPTPMTSDTSAQEQGKEGK
ncbi:MAG: NADH-quinone oxidoreductase subunit C [Coriobacteriia bacterium]|nr:NADH-quinone oxidoreductase subunit C [Coriobacteriia bacterium]